MELIINGRDIQIDEVFAPIWRSTEIRLAPFIFERIKVVGGCDGNVVLISFSFFRFFFFSFSGGEMLGIK